MTFSSTDPAASKEYQVYTRGKTMKSMHAFN